jgi:cytochrome P450
LRDEAPVYHNTDVGFWALSRYQDVIDAHLNTDVFSSTAGATIEGLDRGLPFLIVKDPPEHTWHRKVVARVFTPRRIAGLEPFIRETTRRLLDDVAGQPEWDFVEKFSIRLPLEVISELVGIPPELRGSVHDACDKIAVQQGAADAEQAMQASNDLLTMLLALVVDRRKNPGDDVISLLLNTEVEDDAGRRWSLSDEEVAYRFLELAFAGHETVAKLLPNGLIGLQRFPDQRRKLVADRDLLPNAVEEMLRWDPPSHYQGRWTLEPIVIHGVEIPADQRVILITGSAVRDERQYPDPDVVDITRDIDRHVSFGFGRHLCLGASLARLETRVAVDEVLTRFPEYVVDEARAERAYSSNVRGLASLPFRAAA